MPMSIGGKFRHGGDRVIHLRHARPSLWHAGLAKDIEDLWEPWMREADRLMELARERGIVEGRRMRVDTTVVETNIHYPTDSSLLGDGARVLTRTMKKIEAKTGGLRKKIRDRMRTVKKRVMATRSATREK